MTTQDKIEVMKAYNEGKKIQWKPRFAQGWDYWNFSYEPAWDWVECDYRIKPEEKYRPYKDTDEMIEDFKRRFNVEVPQHYMPTIWVRDKGTNVRSHVSGFDFDRITICGLSWDMQKLFKNFTYLDGSPCGISEDN